ncbi:MAG: hypothetical protein JSW51_11105 [Gemmatimonadota bacterium]|nr:MAG: hypothetical protein JSW51_11105 [Gemmatimonadota bacterium]
MKTARLVYTILLTTVAATACSKRVLVPPRLDLHPYPAVGLVTFTMENSKGDLERMATDRFLAEIHNAQPGTPVVELGDYQRLLEECGREKLDREALQTLANQYGVATVFVGHMKASNINPRASISSFPSVGVGATVSVELTVRMLETEVGATVWTNTAKASESVGELGLSGGQLVFGAQDPKKAYGDLVDYLVSQVTTDMYSTYR